MDIAIKPIGLIKSDFKVTTDIPRQSIYGKDKKACAIIDEEYALGLQGLQAGQFIEIVFYFNKSDKAPLLQYPCCGIEKKGVFSIRSPHRPNHIGISKVKILKIEKNIVYFTGVDMLNDTPIIDIKPSIAEI
ncbi:tRNA (N6-threonylcarbamoyladenosine(37)-N6)-methyltransferase TrmO [Pectinatus sottacetonis]|uniref:tRNA (N6-threonylcarbamoyladenosine(37)-N6)-methyltransferase TrmO n=1 Tax=Pectinatus sottacetonis TaxID=1002795 RepID=UPI0018C4680E|nr:tRNA (N6-threonylcarbamoyladenosine(37)-N6)-methyltransferase TrmO [Pectinatus sottacetonis]